MAIVIEQQIHAQSDTAGSITTTSFTPAAGTVVVAGASFSGGSGDTDQTLSFSDSGAGSWQKPVERSRGTGDSGALPPPVAIGWTLGGGSSITVTATPGGQAGGAKDLHVWVLSGVDTANPIIVTGEATGDPGVISISLNTGSVDNALLLGKVVDWFAQGDPTAEAGSTSDNATTMAGSNSVWSGHKAVGAGGTYTIGTSAPSNAENNGVAVAIRPSSAGAGAAIPANYLPPHLIRLLAAYNARQWQSWAVADAGYTQTPTDDAGLTDPIAIARGLGPTDSAGLTDTVSITIGMARTDSAGLLDSAALTAGLARTDDAGLTDTVTIAVTRAITTTDDAGLTDTAVVQLGKLVTATDDAGLTDTRVLDLALARTDSAGLTDTVSITVQTSRTDDVGLTDPAAVESIKFVARTDSAGLLDSVTLQLFRGFTVNDSAGLLDARALALAKAPTDAVGLRDPAALARTLARTDSAGLSDSVPLSRLLARTDSAGLTDTVTVLRIRSVTTTDSAGLTDTVSTAVGTSTVFVPAGLIPIRTYTADEIITGNRFTRFRFDLFSRVESPLGDLAGVRKGEIDFTSNASIHSGGALEVRDTGQNVDWLNDRVRPVVIIDGLPEIPLGMFIFSEAPENWASTGRTWPLKLLDKTGVLVQDKVAETYALDAGTVITDTVAALIASTGETNIAITPSAATLANPLAWEAGTTKLKIVNDLLSVAGYFSLFCNRDGQFRGEPYVRPANRPITYEFLDGARSIYRPDFVRDVDLFSIPNRFVAVGKGDATTAALTSVYTNTDPASPYSYPSRGRYVVESATGVEAADQATLDAYARRRLIELTSPTSSIDVLHALVPDLTFNHAARLRRVPAGIDARHVVTKMVVPLMDVKALVRSSLQEVVDL